MIRLVGLLVVVSACVKSNAVECRNGDVCPAGMQCDDLNGGCIVTEQREVCGVLVDGDACSWSTGVGECSQGVCLPHVCGDGRLSGPERCDPTATDVDQAMRCNSEELGYYETAEVTCRADCQWDISPCETRCGDAVLQPEHELCEEGVPLQQSCVDYGFDRGTLGCAVCGPGVSDCDLIGWTRYAMPGKPGGGLVADGELIALIADPGGAHLAARVVNNSWVGLGAPASVSGELPLPYAIAATSLSNIWVGGTTNTGTGDLGFVSRYDGTSWTRVRTFPSIVTALWAHGTHVFAMSGADLFVFDGTAWSSQTLETTSMTFSISGSSASDVWIGGGKLWRGGAGQAFTEVTLPATGDVTGVHTFGADGVAVAIHEGANQLVLHVRENGTWRALPWPTSGRLGVPHVRASNDIFMLVTDVTSADATQIGHHDGTSWVRLTEPTMQPTAIVGSTGRGLVAVEGEQFQALHYAGMAWLAKTPHSTVLTHIAGTDPNLLWATEPSLHRPLRTFDGNAWSASTTDFGVVDALPGGVMYAINPSAAAGNPELLEWNGQFGWSEIELSTANEYAEWIGVHGADDVFLKLASIGTLPQYVHWAGTGNSEIEATLETTNIPDGTDLRYIDCRPGVGCYAAGPSGLWHTPGDRNAWASQPDVDIGGYNALWVESSSFVLLGGSFGRIGRFDGTTWHVDQLPTASPVVMLAVAGATDAFALARSVASTEEHQLYHWDGTSWTRVRTPVSAFGSKVDSLWTSGRITYLGGGTTTRYFYALVRSEPW